jgi:hypothetical protein
VYLRGARELVWVGRWREDVIGADGKTHRVCRKEVLGSKRELQTKKLALRELANRVPPINCSNDRALRAATFAEFCAGLERERTDSAQKLNSIHGFEPRNENAVVKEPATVQ